MQRYLFSLSPCLCLSLSYTQKTIDKNKKLKKNQESGLLRMRVTLRLRHARIRGLGSLAGVKNSLELNVYYCLNVKCSPQICF